MLRGESVGEISELITIHILYLISMNIDRIQVLRTKVENMLFSKLLLSTHQLKLNTRSIRNMSLISYREFRNYQFYFQKCTAFSDIARHRTRSRAGSGIASHSRKFNLILSLSLLRRSISSRITQLFDRLIIDLISILPVNRYYDYTGVMDFSNGITAL